MDAQLHDLWDVDGHRRRLFGAESTSECPAASWRASPLATNPTPNEDFQFDSLNYYTTIVIGATWPAFLGLAAFAGLLLAFILWRSILVCSACKKKRSRNNMRLGAKEEGHSAALPTPLPLSNRTAYYLKIAMGVMFLGVVAGSIYGMIMVNADLVDEGVETLDEVTSYIENVVGTAEGAVEAADGIDRSLANVQTIINRDVNASDILTQLECLRPWLDGLPSPSPLRQNVEDAYNLATSLPPRLDAVSQQLSLLQSSPAAPGEASTGALPTLLAAQPQLQNIQAQEAAFATAAAGVTLPSENYAAMVTARDTLAALLQSPPWAEKLAVLDVTADALYSLESAIAGASSELSGVLSTAETLLAPGGPALELNATLAGQSTAYTAVRPCIAALTSKVQFVNSSVLQLPDSLSEDINLLEATQARLDAVLGLEPSTPSSDTGARQLADALSDADGALEQARDASAQLNDAQQQLTANPLYNLGTLAATLRSTRAAMAAAETSLTTLLNEMNSYAAMNPGFLRTARYTLLAPQVQTAGIAAGSTAATTQTWLNTAAPLFFEAQSVSSQLEESNIIAQLTSLSADISALPDSEEVLAALDGYAGDYASLPSPPSELVNSAASTITEVVNEVETALVDARSSVSDVIGEAGASIATLRENSLDKIEQYQAQYEPEVRTYDALRQAVVYACFALAILFCGVLLAGVGLVWPAALKLSTCLFLILLTIIFALVVALTAGLKVGTDACANLEAQIEQRLASDPEAAAVAAYYLHGDGPGVKWVLEEVFDVDVDVALEQVRTARERLLTQVNSTYPLKSLLQTQVNAAVGGSFAVAAGILEVVRLVSYEEVHPVYQSIKAWPCCSVLNMAGGVWTGMLVVGSFAFVECILAMVLIGWYDKLPLERCCGCYKAPATWPNNSASDRDHKGPKNGGSGVVSLVANSSSSSPSMAALPPSGPLNAPNEVLIPSGKSSSVTGSWAAAAAAKKNNNIEPSAPFY